MSGTSGEKAAMRSPGARQFINSRMRAVHCQRTPGADGGVLCWLLHAHNMALMELQAFPRTDASGRECCSRKITTGICTMSLSCPMPPRGPSQARQSLYSTG